MCSAEASALTEGAQSHATTLLVVQCDYTTEWSQISSAVLSTMDSLILIHWKSLWHEGRALRAVLIVVQRILMLLPWRLT